MTKRADPTTKEELLGLLRMELKEPSDYETFRIRFEDNYTFRLDRRTLTTAELDVLERLFNVVTRYSPFLKDREKYPGVYADEAQFRRAVDTACRELGIARESTQL